MTDGGIGQRVRGRRGGDGGHRPQRDDDRARPGACRRGGAVLELTALGGFVVEDDLTPGRPVDGDAVRELLLRDPRLVATEVLLRESAAAIVAVKVAQ